MDELKVNTVYMRQDTRFAQYLPYPQYLLTLDIKEHRNYNIGSGEEKKYYCVEGIRKSTVET